MKYYSKYFFAATLTSTLFIACTKDQLLKNRAEQSITDADLTRVRFIHASSTNQINTVSPVLPATPAAAMNFFINGVRLNAITTASLTFTTAYGGAFPGAAISFAGSANGNNVFDYAAIPSGATRVSGAIFRLTGGSSADTVASTVFNFNKLQKYTVVAADTFPNQRFFAYEDNFITPDTGNYSIRLINLGANVVSGAATAVDLFSRRRQANIVSNVAYKGASDFVESKVANLFNGVLTTTDTLEIRAAGTTTILVQLNGFFPVRTRVYTIVSRGSSTNVSPRNLSAAGYLNR
jgi:hypothetical protein